LNGFQKSLEYFTESELHANGFSKGKNKQLEFESGLMVKGNILNILTKEGKNLILSFADCTVSYQDKVLFEPAWGVFDMAVGELIYSAFSGPADPKKFDFSFNAPEEKTHKIIYSEKAKLLHTLYQQVRDIREGKNDQASLEEIYSKVVQEYPKEWLLISEIFELSKNFKYNGLSAKLESNLIGLKNSNPDLSILIENGMKVYG
jgi:phenylalanine-4-hydroxylase